MKFLTIVSYHIYYMKTRSLHDTICEGPMTNYITCVYAYYYYYYLLVVDIYRVDKKAILFLECEAQEEQNGLISME